MESLSVRITDATDETWTMFVENHEDANIFHHPAWSAVLESSYGFRPFALTCADAGGTIRAGVPLMEIRRFPRPRRWVSLPFSDHCSPLAESPQDYEGFVHALDAFAQTPGLPHMEFRWDLTGASAAQTSPPYVLHTLSLPPNPDDMRSRIHHSHLRNVRLARERGVRVVRGERRADMDAFYALHVETRRKQGVPVQPRGYFERLEELLLNKGLGFILLAYHGNTCLAGAVFLHWKKTLTYKYGASTRDGLGLRPNHLIFWEAIEWGCRNGFSIFDFGRTDTEHESLRMFKSRWGASETPLRYTPFPVAPRSARPAGNVARTIIQNFIRMTPAAICKWSGLIYYKHLA